MSGSSSHDSPSRKAQTPEDALDDVSSRDAALGRTLEAELTRAATRANPTSLDPSAEPPATSESLTSSAKSPAPPESLTPAAGSPATTAALTPPAALPETHAVPSGVPALAPVERDLDLISAASAGADATADGEGFAAEDPDADADAEGDQSGAGASRRPRIGWGGVLALLNVVLSGFILMLWGVPRWDGARIGTATRAKAGAAGAGAQAGAGARTSAGAGANRVEADARRVDPNPSGASSAAASDAAARSTAASLAGGAAGNAASGFGSGAVTGRAPRSGVTGAPDAGGDAGADGGAPANGGGGASRVGAQGGANIPDLPQAIISVMPGQRAPDVTIPPVPPPSTATRRDNAGAAAAGNVAGNVAGSGTNTGAVTAGADAAIEAGNAAARTAPPPRAGGDDAGPRIPIAGADGVTMPERLAESHVRPTIAALADGEPVTGEVTLAATIRVDGSVADVQVLSSSRPGAGLEHAAADAVRRWRYKPATRDGQPIDSRLTITVTFR